MTKFYFVQIDSEKQIEEICFKNYQEALKFAKEINYGKVYITDSIYNASEKIR